MAERDKKTVIRINQHDAFMVVDMNKDMLLESGRLHVGGIPGEASPGQLIERILRINGLRFHFRFVVSDMHPPDHIESRVWREHALAGSPGQAWPDELGELYARANFRLIKGMEPEIISIPLYTSRGFFRLIPLLRRKGVKRIFGAGLAYDYCLGESLIALTLQGFEAFVVRDAARSVSPPCGHPEVMAAKLKSYGVKEVLSTNLC